MGEDNNNSFAEKIGSNRQTVANMIASGKLSGDFINLLLNVFPKLSLDWLIKGEGEMFKSDTPIMTISRTEPQDADKWQMPKVIYEDRKTGEENILYVPVAAYAGYLRGYGDPEYIDHVETYRLPNLKGSTYRMFQVKGDSMYPTLKDGDIVVAEWVPEKVNGIRDERVHVLVTESEGIIVKRAINATRQLGVVNAKSDNIGKDKSNRPLYPTISLDPKTIKEVWYARGYFSYSFTAPNDTYNRLTSLEIEFELIRNEFQNFKKLLPPKP